MVTRAFDPFDPVVLTIGSFHSGTMDNVIPDEASFSGTVRSFNPASHEKQNERVVDQGEGLARAHGLDADVGYVQDFPVMVNDAGEAAFMADTVREVYGEERYLDSPRPFPTSEDFAFVCNEVPSAFVVMGACPAGADPAKAAVNHSPEARYDDAVLADGAALYAELAVRRLAREAREG
jgi:hippurate hydrolase